ncbi:MAG TPA: prepilin-type N-terminal cleavage/methylation domain-containing protein, partial [Capsulimonadaceae bacterium]|nr:prepilin-type N-terminal cleavage/methylation domain-containing protein [Capsulimonadaceae bacterium]
MHSIQLRRPSHPLRRGFSLIELLVVIAIIAILAAIIFPVFSAVRENARESTTMSSMHNIYSALELYKLDNHRYPDVLFAYACNGQNDSVTNLPCSANDTMTDVASDPNAHDLLVGLYPEYDKNWQDFTCPNNPITNTGAKTPAPLAINVLCPKTNASGSVPYTDATGLQPCTGATANGQLAAAQQWFFEADAMDVSPLMSNVNQFAGGNSTPSNWTWMPRYQTSWMSYANTPPGNPNNANNATVADYVRQLRWQNPPGNTY